MRRLVAAALCASLAAAPAAAQPSDRKPARPAPTPQAAPPPPPPATAPDPNAPPPYEPQMMRLAELLGALHHLRTVCKAPDADLWRDRLAALIEADAPTQERRDRLAGAFNSSFRTWARSYRSCTPAAETASRMFLAETAKLAGDMRARFGP
ncbi:TIGR02301 family protein [Methylopila sp. M107]|uniref:TIGR02301 family protein n=1 Tax=Methylopila sp. M107 TaxID=1101190 RepID=UPI000369C89F|nr:TIGR02301 family protein [Methylopila sp. M107]